MALVNFESVAAAAETLTAAGQRPTVRAVTAAIGGGSPNTVIKLLSEWKAGRPVLRIADTSIDSSITDAIKVQMQRMSEAAAAAAEERAAELDENLQALIEAQSKSEQQHEKDSATQIALSIERDTAQAQLQEITAELARQKEQAAQTLTELRQDTANERVKQEQTTAGLARAEVRLEALPGLQTEIEQLRQALKESDQTRTQSDQIAAVLAAKLEASERRAKDADARTTKSDSRADAAAIETAAAHTALQACQGRLETAIKDAAMATSRAESAIKEAATAQAAAKKSAQELADMKKPKPETKPKNQGALGI